MGNVLVQLMAVVAMLVGGEAARVGGGRFTIVEKYVGNSGAAAADGEKPKTLFGNVNSCLDEGWISTRERTGGVLPGTARYGEEHNASANRATRGPIVPWELALTSVAKGDLQSAIMMKRTLGKTGLSVTALGFGSAPVGYLNTEKEAAGRLLNALLDKGINLIDTAASYPGSEELIGEYVGHRRDEFVLVSKCGQAFEDVPGKAWTAEVVTGTVDRSLKRLRTDAIDVMLLHSCNLRLLKESDALAGLVAAREAGKIRFIGYSGDNEAAAHAAGLADIAVIEASVSIADQANIDVVLPVTVANNVGVLAKRPIANAAWRDISQQQGMYQNYAKTYTDRLTAMKLSPADVGLPAGAWSEMALRFTLSQPGVHCAIIGTTKESNLDANADIIAKGPLPAAAIEKIRAAFRAADPNGKWTGQT